MYDEFGKAMFESIDSMIDNFSERVLTKYKGTHENSSIEDFLTGFQRKRIKTAIQLEFEQIIKHVANKLEEK